MAVLERLESEVRSANSNTQEERIKKARNRPRSRITKVIKAGVGKIATVAIAPDLIDLSAPDSTEGEPMGISIVGGAGTVLRGPVSFTNRPGEIRVAGFWVLNDLLLSATPSTIMTPIPVTRFSPPLDSVAKYVKSAAVIAAMTGALI